MACAICDTRRPRRHCPGVRGEICAICCGTAREVTVDCPLDCEYLQEARKREKPPAVDPAQIPNRDIRVSEKLLEDNQDLLVALSTGLLKAAMETPGAVDFDVRDALDALIRTYRTLESGIYYESRPDNALAANIFSMVQSAVEEFRRNETERLGLTKTRDADILGLLAFMRRIELDRNNGKPRGRAFLETLRGFYTGPGSLAPAASSLVLP